jgi:transglutaminase-like putative cysteine protease
MAALLALVIANYGNLFGREPGTLLGCGLLVLKLLETERVRDARVALGFAAFVLMSALLFVQTLLFTALICLVLVLMVASLVSLQPAPLDPRQPLRAELRLSALLLGCGLPLAAAAFVLIPRLGTPLWGAPGADKEARTGLSDTLSPGQITDLLIDDSPALRADFSGPPPAPAQRYFRTMVMWDFDGTTWSRGGFRGHGDTEEAVRRNDQRSAPFTYRITLEPTDRRWLPALDLPLSVSDDIRIGADRVLYAHSPVMQPRQYEVVSATDRILAPSLTAVQRLRTLALPSGFNPRTRELANRWRSEGRNDNAIVRAALDLFHASFTYTLSPPLLARDSADDFLFNTRAGFCEHYASAFVILMRAAGIPARVVTGYQGGWWNAESGYLLVRQSDAHAWAEVWGEGRGWQRVDPTAAVSPARIELGAMATNDNTGWSQSEWLRGLRNRFDFANRLWTESIIRFDALRQKGILTPFGMAEANQGDLLLVLSGVLGVLMLIATIWAMRAGPRARGDALDQAWSRLGQRLGRGGFSVPPNEGPLDLLRRAHAVSPALGSALDPLVGEYVELRYGIEQDASGRIAAFVRAARRFRMPRNALPMASATAAHSAASR